MTTIEPFPFGAQNARLSQSLSAAVELGRLAKRVLDHLVAAADAADVPPGRWRVLVALGFQAPDGGATAGELAGALGVSLPTLTRLVNPLVTERLVSRSRDAADRRVVRLRLTEAGRRRLSASLPVLGERARTLVSGLGGTEQTTSIARALQAALPAQESLDVR